ncbi:nuclear factor kappa-B-binding protein [Rhynchospora pubera]|uniref:Nuclear factor kappa-B-binding protein n=1 Tax=Rhynchospora pubera TaxID=906938 RepID=A0AAV8H5Q1_9POAL|nr:nuclear factor kappa-B-binding protein [Rhynchospora pubera]
MTCRMAAGQQKRRLSNSNLHDPIKGKKKKKLDSSDYTLSLRPHVDLDWDERRKRVMPRKEQVGLAWKDLAPFVDTVPQPCKGLADVFHVPKEIFGLKDLSNVLSYEVWASCLSESDRKLLSQFLPSGISTGQAVRSLLKGENLHFGNQFTKWSASVCCGDMHPDAVRLKEKQFRSDRKASYVELNNYHSRMIEDLEGWKEKWLNCKDPEKLFRDTPTKHKAGSVTSPPEKPKVNKREVLQKIIRTDTAKYMSYVKISKSQYEQVKNLKHSGEGFQPKLLAPVLGDIKKLSIKPYESFMEEEKTRLHEHWLQVAKEALPLAFETWKGRNLEIQQWKKALIVEIPAGFEAWKERKTENEQLTKSSSTDVDDERMSDMEEDMNSQELEGQSEQLMMGRGYISNSSPNVSEEPEESEEGEEEQEDELQQEEEEREEEDDEEEEREEDEVEPEAEVETKDMEEVEAVEGNSSEEDLAEEQEAEDIAEEPVPLSEEHNNLNNMTSYRHDLERIPSLNSHHQDASAPPETDTFIPVSTSSEIAEPFPCDEMGQPTSPDKWVPVSDYNRQHEYMKPRESSLKLPELIPQQRSAGVGAVIDLERNVMEMDNGASIFYPELIPSFQKEPEMLPPSYAHGGLNGMKQHIAGLTPSYLMTRERPPESLQAQQRLLEQRQQVRDNNMYMHQQQQPLNKPPMYPTSSYSNQGHLSPMGPTRQNMNVNINMTNDLRLPLNNTGYTWFPQEHQMHANNNNTNSWSGMDTSSSTSDGSLFSVLSECTKIQPRMQYQGMNPEQYSAPRSFGMAGGVDNVYGYMPPQLGRNNNSSINNRSDNTGTSAGTMDSLAWMNFRHQNSNPGMPDSTGQTFSRPWGR